VRFAQEHIHPALHAEGDGSRPNTGAFAALEGFRERLHGAMRRRKDALFELADAILTAGHFPSLPHLSRRADPP
jgi:hypothetical protein